MRFRIKGPFRGRLSHVAVAATIVLGVWLFGCQAQQVAPTAQPPAAAQPSVLKIGLMFPLTGPVAAPGTRAHNANQLAVDDYNAKGGLKVGGKTYRLEAVSVDDQGTPDGGRQACDRLVLAEKVKLIVGSLMPPAVAGCQSVADPNNVMLSVAGATGTLGPNHPTTFATGTPHGSSLYEAVTQWFAKAHPEVKRVSFVTFDDVGGRSDAEQGIQALKDAGLTVVGTEFFPFDAKDFSALVTRVLAQKPDAIELGHGSANMPTSFYGIAKALTEQGFKGTWFGLTANMAPAQAGPIAEGYAFPYLADPDSPALSAMAKDIINRFVQKYGGDKSLQADASQFYNEAFVLLQAVEKAGTVDDGKKIAEVLRANKWDTTFGTKAGFGGAKTEGIASVLELPLFLGKVQGGKNVNFGMVTPALP